MINARREEDTSVLLEGKKILVTGVITDQSIAFTVAKLAQEQGAQIVLTAYPRPTLVERFAKRLPVEPPVIPLDVTNADELAGLADKVREYLPSLDGVVHSIGFAPQTALGGNFLETPWDAVAAALHASTFSYKSLATALLPLLNPGASIVGLTLDATVAYPVYDWMGVAKAGLESASRYLAQYLGAKGIRSNLVSAGPLRTMAAKSIPGFEKFEESWSERAPLGWELTDIEPAAKGVIALLSDWFPATTGEIVHVDGGYHAIAG